MRELHYWKAPEVKKSIIHKNIIEKPTFLSSWMKTVKMLWDTFLLLHQLSLVVFVYEFVHSFFSLGVCHALPGILAFLELNLCIFDFTFSCEVPGIGKSTSFLSFLFCCIRVQVVYISMISILKSSVQQIKVSN